MSKLLQIFVVDTTNLADRQAAGLQSRALKNKAVGVFKISVLLFTRVGYAFKLYSKRCVGTWMCFQFTSFTKTQIYLYVNLFFLTSYCWQPPIILAH